MGFVRDPQSLLHRLTDFLSPRGDLSLYPPPPSSRMHGPLGMDPPPLGLDQLPEIFPSAGTRPRRPCAVRGKEDSSLGGKSPVRSPVCGSVSAPPYTVSNKLPAYNPEFPDQHLTRDDPFNSVEVPPPPIHVEPQLFVSPPCCPRN